MTSGKFPMSLIKRLRVFSPGWDLLPVASALSKCCKADKATGKHKQEVTATHLIPSICRLAHNKSSYQTQED